MNPIVTKAFATAALAANQRGIHKQAAAKASLMDRLFPTKGRIRRAAKPMDISDLEDSVQHFGGRQNTLMMDQVLRRQPELADAVYDYGRKEALRHFDEPISSGKSMRDALGGTDALKPGHIRIPSEEAYKGAFGSYLNHRLGAGEGPSRFRPAGSEELAGRMGQQYAVAAARRDRIRAMLGARRTYGNIADKGFWYGLPTATAATGGGTLMHYAKGDTIKEKATTIRDRLMQILGL